MMKRMGGILLAVWMAAIVVSAQAPAAQGSASLYKRLGGYDAIAAVVDDFVPKLVTDPQLAKFFTGHGNDSKMKVRQLAVDQICMLTGGPCLYIGRPTKTAHAGLGITESDWQVAVKHLVTTLDKFKVPAKEKDELVAAIATLKPDVVEKK